MRGQGTRGVALVLLLVGSVAAQEPAFVRWNGTAPAIAREVAEAGGTTLRIEGARVLRRRGDTEIELRCTLAGGIGEPLALARHPLGGTYVLGARGLFLTDAEHDWLDPVDLRDGAPQGAPRGMHVGVDGRIWLATETEFGVLEPRWWFGRTFTAADGLPPAPFHALAADAEGALLLLARDGWFRYVPDRGSAPSGTLRNAKSGWLRGSPDGTAEVDVDATANGGATLRFRRQHHHLLFPVRDGQVYGFKPGRHGVDLVAFDRDLRSTRIASVGVEIPYPRGFDLRWLPRLAVIGLLVVAAAWIWRERRRAPWGVALGRAFLQCVITIVIGLQLLAAVLGYGKAWPFVGFTMYADLHREMDAVHRPRLFLLHEGGSQSPVTFEEAGLLQDGYWQVLAEIVYGPEELRRELHARLVERWSHRGPPIIGFVVQDQRVRLTRDGPVEVAPAVILRWVAR